MLWRCCGWGRLYCRQRAGPLLCHSGLCLLGNHRRSGYRRRNERGRRHERGFNRLRRRWSRRRFRNLSTTLRRLRPNARGRGDRRRRCGHEIPGDPAYKAERRTRGRYPPASPRRRLTRKRPHMARQERELASRSAARVQVLQHLVDKAHRLFPVTAASARSRGCRRRRRAARSRASSSSCVRRRAYRARPSARGARGLQ